MAKFRERCAVFLLGLCVLTMLAILHGNPLPYGEEFTTTSDAQDMPGIETFSNLKRSKMSYEMIYPSDDFLSEDDLSNDVENIDSGLDITPENDNNVVIHAAKVVDQVVVLPGESIIYNVEPVPETLPTERQPVPQRPPNMTLILSESRSGSTWLLETLAHPDTTMQFFEPLNGKLHAKFLELFGPDETPEVWMKNRQFKLCQICSCNLSTQWGALSGWQRNYVDRTGIRMPQVIDLCLSKQTRVAKTIRMYNITELAALPGMGCTNFKVVHLVRDPRAIMLSRMETFHELYDGNHKLGPRLSGSQREFDEDYMRRASKDYCRNQLYNYRVGHNPPPWLDYHLIKYEDLALTPLESVRPIFEFINQPFTEEMSEFVYQASHGSKGRGGYTTHKNSSSVLVSWKGRLLWRHVEVIQEECREFMKELGYGVISQAAYSLL